MKKQLLVLAIIALFAVPQNGQALELTNSQKSEWEQFIEKAETAEKLKKVNGKLIASVLNHMGKALEHIAQAANHAAQAAKNSEQATKQN